MRRTYYDLARIYSVELCQECSRLRVHDHEVGHVQPMQGIVHWRERRMTRSGLRHFLLLVAAVDLYRDGYRGGGLAEWIWMTNTWAYREAMLLGVRLSRKLSAVDRARVRYLLQGKRRSRAQMWAREG